MTDIDLDRVFCGASKRFNLPKLYLKSIATIESSLNPRAFRFEQGFWDRYLKDNPLWKDKDPQVVSASFGLMQIMFVVAYESGFVGTPEDLYNPVINVELGAKILRKHLDKIEKSGVHIKYRIWPLEICAARFNGGSGGNPGPDGRLRNMSYVNKVFSTWKRLSVAEKECDENA